MDYKGYKLIDEIILVCKKARRDEDYMQAYLVDPANKKQLETARHWATYTEYGPWHRDPETGRGAHEYQIEHDPVEFTFANEDFRLELLNCAGGSSQGGKLSFWNCLVKKDDNVFKIGINSEMLLDLLKNATFNKGACEDPLVFITCKGRVGLTIVGSDLYKQCLKDRELKNTIKAAATTKYSFGSSIQTATINEFYLGKLTRYYSFNSDGQVPCGYGFDPRRITVTKLAKPVEVPLTDYDWGNIEKVSELLDKYSNSIYSSPVFVSKRPKRVVAGSLELDVTEEEFYKQLLGTGSFKEYLKTHEDICVSDLFRFLNRSLFGMGTEPFELDNELLKEMKAAGIRYIDETEQA